MSSSNICPFCDASQSYRYITETSLMRVIYPRNPAVQHHLLITPKRHVKQVNELTEAESEQLFQLIKKLNTAAQARLGGAYLGFNLLSNNGSSEINQQVPHAHMHIFLRTSRDKVDPLLAPHTKIMDFTDSQIKDMQFIKAWFGS